MRTLLALVVAIASIVGACGGPAVTTDPYQLLQRSQATPWERVQVDVGIAVSGSEAFTVDPSALRFAVDTKAGKANVHVAVPMAALGELSGQFGGLLGAGDTLELDVIYDGEALYMKSPLGTALAALMIQAGEFPTGDMTGWLRLLSKDDLASIGPMLGGSGSMPIPLELPFPSAADPATLKTKLDEMGITLTHAGTASRNGADAEKVTATVDLARFAETDQFKRFGSSGLVDLDPAEATLSFDLYFDRGSGRLVGVDVHAASTGDASQTAEITINLHEPAADVSFDAPAVFVEVPLMEMLGSMMQLFGGGLLPQ